MAIRKGLIILGDLSDKDLLWLSENGAIEHITPGTALIEAGQNIDDLFIITDGCLDILVDDMVLAEAGTGDILGEMSFVEKRPTSATVVAKTYARALRVPRRALVKEFKTNTAFAARFYRALAVFLSDRLRSMTSGSERGDMDEAVRKNVSIAGDRLLRLIDVLEGDLTPT